MRIRRCALNLAMLWLLSAFPAHAADFSYDAFAALPIQHEGRIKPLETFALVHLERFHGAALGNESAIAWLAHAMFDPADAMQQPLFVLKDADAQSMLGLPARPDHFYSFSEVTQAMAANQKLMRSLLQRPVQELSPGQRAAVELYENTGLFAQITLSCTSFLRLNIDLPAEEMRLFDRGQPPSAFIDYYKRLPELQASLRAVVRRKGEDLRAYTPAEMQLAQAAQRLSVTMESSRDNTLLRVVPPQWGNDAWLSPWAMFHAGQGSPETARIIGLWRALAAAYQAHDAASWQRAASALVRESQAVLGVRPSALALEVLYYRVDPLGKSMGLYALGFVLTVLGLGMAGLRRPLRVAAFATACAGAFLHCLSIFTRIYILERPPVGTLYESLLFVSLIAAGFGLYLEYRLRNNLGLLVATLAGSALLFTSQSFGGEDSMGMLIAVLNTNFWLVTHVLCITSGYGFGLVAGIIAHVYLLMRCVGYDADKARRYLRAGYGTALIALLFTALGTILGGIWADQSWGRFWGWDPKENGALLICLWLIWLLHGRISSRLRERGFAVGLALLNVVIALSWLGVNLLATGLHSYGFTDKAAWALAAFCTVEFAFAAVAYTVLWRRDRAA